MQEEIILQITCECLDATAHCIVLRQNYSTVLQKNKRKNDEKIMRQRLEMFSRRKTEREYDRKVANHPRVNVSYEDMYIREAAQHSRRKASDVTDNQEDIARLYVYMRTIIKQEETLIYSTRLCMHLFVFVLARACILFISMHMHASGDTAVCTRSILRR